TCRKIIDPALSACTSTRSAYIRPYCLIVVLLPKVILSSPQLCPRAFSSGIHHLPFLPRRFLLRNTPFLAPSLTLHSTPLVLANVTSISSRSIDNLPRQGLYFHQG